MVRQSEWILPLETCETRVDEKFHCKSCIHAFVAAADLPCVKYKMLMSNVIGPTFGL